MKTTETYPLLLEALHAVRGQWRFAKILEGVLLAVAGGVAVLTALVLVDNLFQPDVTGRLVLAVLLWGSLIAALFGLVVRRVLEDRRDDFFAALVERKHPELRNQLINALQLGRGEQRGCSTGLIEAIVRDANRATGDMNMSDCVNWRPPLYAALFAVLALLLIGGYAAAFTPRFANGLERVLLPVGDIAPYTRTIIVAKSIVPGDKKFHEGVDVPFEVAVEGEVPKAAVLHHRAGRGPWRDEEMPADESAKTHLFTTTVPHAMESFEYYITAGDARSATHRVEVVKPPRVDALALTYTFPPYLGLPDEKIAESNGVVAAVAGTTVALDVTTSKPVKLVRLEIDGAGPVYLEQSGDGGRTWKGSFVIWTARANPAAPITGRRINAPANYHIYLADDDGYQNDTPAKTITAVPDLAPRVVLRDAGEKALVAPDAVVPVVVDATDDHGLAEVRLLYRVNNQEKATALEQRIFAEPNKQLDHWDYRWDVVSTGLKTRDKVEFWAEATDRNDITGPGKAESRHLTFEVIDPKQTAEKLNYNLYDYARELERLLKLQSSNRTATAENGDLAKAADAETAIRAASTKLARAMERDGTPLATVWQSLDVLVTGDMAEAMKLLESGRDAAKESIKTDFRTQSLPVQDRIIAKLKELISRLQNDERARDELKKIEKKDPEAHKALTAALADLIKNLDQLLKDQTQVAGKFEKLPNKNPNEIKDEQMKAILALDDLAKRTEKWSKGSIGELPKLGEGFVDDFKLRKDVNKIFEEVEKAAGKSKAEKAEVSLEDLGAGLATKMKEDLESWLPDSADATQWVLEEPTAKKGLKVPEMPLPKALEDMIGDLLQKADEFDKDADDVTSAWADNLDQAGWGVSDGPISSFSAKGKTGNDMPNNMELTGRSGDGRRGKSSGQAVGDTAKGLKGRPTPARVGNEKFEPGQMKQEGADDPNGVTGGGKKAGAGRIGLQGDAPPDMVKDMARLSAKQAGLREKADKVARKLDTMGVSSSRLSQSIELMKEIEKDLANGKYEDAARKRREAMQQLRSSFSDIDQATAAAINRAKDLPPQMRNELLQSADEAYPPGYESLLKNYYKSLSTGDK